MEWCYLTGCWAAFVKARRDEKMRRDFLRVGKLESGVWGRFEGVWGRFWQTGVLRGLASWVESALFLVETPGFCRSLLLSLSAVVPMPSGKIIE